MSRITKPLMAAVAVFLSAALFTCAGIAPASQTAAGPSFTGNGGRGMSLAVLIPEGRGIAADQNYLPTMVQGVLVSDLTKYSAISVLDRVRLETVLRETESGIYRNEADYGRLGQIANVDYALTGSITRTGSGYAMQIQVVGTGRNTIGVTKAAYSGTCTIAEFDNFTGIRKASLELLTQMGVALTASARSELSGVGQVNFINAQTFLAQGITAQRGGNEFEAMISYFRARTFSPDLSEASTRTASAMTTLANNNGVNTNLRNQVLSEIQRQLEAARQREERIKNTEELIKQATAFYKTHQPFTIAMVNYFIYGRVDAAKRTVDIGVCLSAPQIDAEFKIIRWIAEQGREVLGQGSQPRAAGEVRSELTWPFHRPNVRNQYQGIWRARNTRERSYGSFTVYEPSFIVVADVVNGNGKTLNRVTFQIKHLFFEGDLRENAMQYIRATSHSVNRRDERLSAWELEGYYRDYRGVSYGSFRGANFILNGGRYEQFFTISANDLTDNLTLRIVSVNGQNINSVISSGSVGIERESALLTGTRMSHNFHDREILRNGRYQDSYGVKNIFSDYESERR